jgi:glutaredoxin
MNAIINIIRNLLGGIIAFFDLITRGKKLQRSAQEQRQIEGELKGLTLYQFFACPFCIKTRRAMHKLNLPIEKRNVSKGSPYRDEMLSQTGKVQTPCLRIENAGETVWLYESSEITSYLRQRFA